MTQEKVDTLEERVMQFRCMELPGQPQFMHMGTTYLVADLWRKVVELEAWQEAAFVAHPNIDIDIERVTTGRRQQW